MAVSGVQNVDILLAIQGGQLDFQRPNYERLSVKRNQSKAKRGRGTSKQAVFGVLCRNGKIWAELIDAVEAKQLQPRILKQESFELIPHTSDFRIWAKFLRKMLV